MSRSAVISPRTLLRWSGGALVVAGVLQSVGTVLHPDDTAATLYFSNARWAPAHVLLAGSFLLAIFGLMGLYLRQSDDLGRLGLVGFVLSVAGCALLVGVTLAEAFLFPVIAANQAPVPLVAWLDPAGPLAGAIAVSVVALLCYTVGFVILGVTSEFAGTLPRYAGYLLAGSTLLSNGEFFGPIGFAIYVVGGTLVGVSLVWLGIGPARD